jgi:hypothetical protein
LKDARTRTKSNKKTTQITHLVGSVAVAVVDLAKEVVVVVAVMVTAAEVVVAVPVMAGVAAAVVEAKAKAVEVKQD